MIESRILLLDNNYYKNREWLKYVEETGILNVIIFNNITKKWRKLNFDLAKNSNTRGKATINELNTKKIKLLGDSKEYEKWKISRINSRYGQM